MDVTGESRSRLNVSMIIEYPEFVSGFNVREPIVSRRQARWVLSQRNFGHYLAGVFRSIFHKSR
jgi:hypothetical protein